MSIENFTGMDTPMKPWPVLAGLGKTLSLPGGKLFFYDTAGLGQAASNAPSLILIHGLGDEADSWRHLIPLLSGTGRRILAPDLPGFGRSEWKGKIGIKAHAQAVLGLMREAGAASPSNPAILVGCSMGAIIAQAAAYQRPDLVKELILIDGCFPLSRLIDKGMLLMGLPFLGRAWYRGFRKNHEGAWKSLFPYYRDLDAMSAEDKDFLRGRVIARVESASQERAYFASLRSLNNLALFGRLGFSRRIKNFPGKIHLLWGEADRVIPAAQNSAFRSLRPDAGFQQIPNAGHLPQQEAPGETVQAILRIMNGNF
ncbi:MAG: alpha/beta hydrolase [Treponema sp.]|jgi:pimeloyl-ACP methyl ester carboxylesterase|nr:alpha/beta hydrolase [Treponema sp.]